MYFLWYLLLGLAAGWIANLIVKGGSSGLFVNLIVGLIGGVARYVAHQLRGFLDLFGNIGTNSFFTMQRTIDRAAGYAAGVCNLLQRYCHVVQLLAL